VQAIALSKCCCVHDVPIHLRGAEEAMKRERNENAEMVTLQEPAQYSQQMANKGCSLQTIQRSNSRIYCYIISLIIHILILCYVII
jgi:hypothetical protein